MVLLGRKKIQISDWWSIWFIVFNATFSNISAISWWPGHLSYKATFCLSKRWPLNTGLSVYETNNGNILWTSYWSVYGLVDYTYILYRLMVNIRCFKYKVSTYSLKLKIHYSTNILWREPLSLGRHCCDRIVVGFTTTCAISASHHQSCE